VCGAHIGHVQLNNFATAEWFTAERSLPRRIYYFAVCSINARAIFFATRERCSLIGGWRDEALTFDAPERLKRLSFKRKSYYVVMSKKKKKGINPAVFKIETKSIIRFCDCIVPLAQSLSLVSSIINNFGTVISTVNYMRASAHYTVIIITAVTSVTSLSANNPTSKLYTCTMYICSARPPNYSTYSATASYEPPDNKLVARFAPLYW